MNEDHPSSQERREDAPDSNDIPMRDAEMTDAEQIRISQMDQGSQDEGLIDNASASSESDQQSHGVVTRSTSEISTDPGCCRNGLTRMIGGSPSRPPNEAGRRSTDELMTTANAKEAAKQSVPQSQELETVEELAREIEFVKHKGPLERRTSRTSDTYSVDGHTVGSIIKEIFKDEMEENPHHDLSCIWNLISDYARFDFEWRVSSPLSWNIDDNMVKRLQGPLDTNNTKYAAVTLNFDTEVVDRMEICLKLKTNAGHEKKCAFRSRPRGFLGRLKNEHRASPTTRH